MDGVAFSFPFTVVDSDRIGSAEEESLTESRRVIVSIADTRRRSWHISDDDLPKVLFEYGKRFIKESVQGDSLPKDNTIRMPMITTVSDPAACPFDFSRLTMPGGVTFQVEVQRRMGFNT